MALAQISRGRLPARRQDNLQAQHLVELKCRLARYPRQLRSSPAPPAPRRGSLAPASAAPAVRPSPGGSPTRECCATARRPAHARAGGAGDTHRHHVRFAIALRTAPRSLQQVAHSRGCCDRAQSIVGFDSFAASEGMLRSIGLLATQAPMGEAAELRATDVVTWGCDPSAPRVSLDRPAPRLW
jgi:hypothetical protein